MKNEQILERAQQVYDYLEGLDNDDAGAVMSIAQSLFSRQYMKTLYNRIDKETK